MKRSTALVIVVALVSAVGCAGRTGSTTRGPIIQRTDDSAERTQPEHDDLTRPVFGQTR